MEFCHHKSYIGWKILIYDKGLKTKYIYLHATTLNLTLIADIINQWHHFLIEPR